MEALKIVWADLSLTKVEGGKGQSYRVSVKSLVSQDKKCVWYAQSNCRESIKEF